jgi:hypothetical protein
MAQQSPLSKSLSVQRSTSCPITLAEGFLTCPGITTNTFGVDPNFRGGYIQDWRLALQADLPFAIQLTTTYNGIRGAHAAQQFLPNTYAYGGTDPCPQCPTGFVYLSSGANSIRHSGELQLRRRLRQGFTATLDYIFANSIDNAAFLGGQNSTASITSSGPQNPFGDPPPTQPDTDIAQNWRDLRAERGRSAFNQRHTVTLSAQYTIGSAGPLGNNLGGKAASLLRDWTILGQFSFNTGQPQTPLFFVATPRTGITGNLRAQLTGADAYKSPAGLHLNPAAFSIPEAGVFGDAGRDSITGPNQLRLNTSLLRVFRFGSTYTLDVRADVTNVLNHVAFTRWNTVVGASQFGLPSSASGMRAVEISSRFRF